jgi:hypothetical protein
MHYTPRTLCILVVLALAASATVVAGELSERTDPAARSAAVPLSQEVLEAAARARQSEQESSKGFGGGSPLVVPAAAFATNGNHDDTYFFHPFQGHMRGKSATDGCVQAPVYLPRGARVFQLYASILDDDSGADVYVTLMRSDNFAYHDADTMGSTHTNGASDSIQTPYDQTIQHPDVEYPRYHYWVSMCLPSADTKLYSVRIYFTDSEIFSDSFESGDTGAWSSP